MTSRSYLGVLVLLPLAACHDDGTTTQHQQVDLCDPASCDGPNPYGAPNYECPDGTVAGPACIAADDGTCSWGIVECAPSDDGCTTEECGPAPGMPNWTCPDGTIGGPACLRDPAGVCGWQILECPEPVPCAWDDCPAPAPGAPNYVCPDGTTIGGPACELSADGTCGWTFVECPACGG